MSMSTPVEGRGAGRPDRERTVGRDTPRRLSTETKASYKTTEFVAYVALMVAILIAGAITSGGVDKSGVHHADVFPAHQVWLYATILTIGYMVSRGLAKAGSRQPYDESVS
jgi:hypothetical protein